MKTVGALSLIMLVPILAGVSQSRFIVSPVSADDSLMRRVLWEPFDRPTIAVQGAAGFADAAICLILAHSAGRGTSIGASALLGLISFSFAVALPGAIYFPGEEMGGDGSLFWTFVGCVVGGTAAIIPAMELFSNEAAPVSVLTAAFAIAGGIIGYHNFSSPVYESDPARRSQQSHFLAPPIPVYAPDNFRLTLISVSF